MRIRASRNIAFGLGYRGFMTDQGAPWPPCLFVGSSSEGIEVARRLQLELEAHGICQVTRWDQGVFRASRYPIPDMVRAAARADFAVLVATPDDLTESRGVSNSTVRDNVIFEAGLFVGAIGLERTYVLPTAGHRQKLPSDLAGLTLLPFTQRQDGNIQAALNAAVLLVQDRVSELGARVRHHPMPLGSVHSVLEREIEVLCHNAKAQGWVVKTNTATTLRLLSPRGQTHTLTKSQPAASREDLRRFAASLRAEGLRVNSSIRRPAHDSPFTA